MHCSIFRRNHSRRFPSSSDEYLSAGAYLARGHGCCSFIVPGIRRATFIAIRVPISFGWELSFLSCLFPRLDNGAKGISSKIAMRGSLFRLSSCCAETARAHSSDQFRGMDEDTYLRISMHGSGYKSPFSASSALIA